MEFIVSSSALLKELQIAAGVLNTSNTLPILDNFLFEINNKELSVSASDLESTLITKIPIETKENGILAIPARLLLETLKEFPEQPLTFSIDLKTFGIEINSDQGKYRMTGHNGDEFPKVPILENPSTCTIPAEILASAIEKTIFATGSDELRPVMSGVFFEFGENELRFVATDAHKLVRYTHSGVNAKDSASFIVPKKPLQILKNILANTNSDVKMQYNESNASFVFDEMTVVCRLIDGKYPNYDAVIPKENPNKLTVSRESLLSSIRRVSIFSNKTTHQVRLNIKGNELALSAEDLDFANEANERLTCSYDGEDMDIGFNSRFMIDMLSNLSTENIVLEMSAPNRPGILLPAEKEDDEDILMLVMPVMLN